MRQRLVKLHRWFGLVAAVWLLGICLSGSIIAFNEELDAWLNPDLFQATAEGSVPDAILAGQARYPDHALRFVMLDWNVPGLVKIGMRDPGGRSHEVFVDSGARHVLGARERGVNGLGPRHLVATIYRLHFEFLGGATMAWLLGLVALLWVIDHLVALGIAFTSAKRWADSLRIRRGVRGHKLNFDLHRAVGLWLYPVTLMLAVSGVYFSWQKEFVTALNVMSPVTPDAADRIQPPLKPAAPLAWSEAYDRLAALAAPETITSFSFNERLQAWRSRMHDPRDLSPNGMRIVWLAADGHLLDDRHETEGTAADVVLAWMFPLHSGMAFGLIGRIIVAVTGLGVAAMIVTGLLLWNRKRQARRAHARRIPSPINATGQEEHGPTASPAPALAFVD